MDRDTLLKALAGTLDSDVQVRKHSETTLYQYEKQPGFTAYCLDLVSDGTISLGVQISAAIFFKNRVTRYWLKAENKTAAPGASISEDEKTTIKTKLIESLIHNYRNNAIKPQLTTALQSILSYDQWTQLLDIILQLFSQMDNEAYIHTGLLCLYQLTKNYRWGLDESRAILNNIVDKTFAILETLASSLVDKEDIHSGEMLNLIVKVFKFSTFSELPPFFKNDANKLGSWCQLHLVLAQKQPPQEVMNMDADLRVKDPRIKCRKWSFANLHRLMSRYGGGISTKEHNLPFVEFFNTHFVPEILNTYWNIIEKWTAGQLWLSEDSVYHLISFFEQCVSTKSWSTIEAQFDAILRHVILPTLSASTESVELFEEDPDEYIRRYFDLYREGNTADVASVNFVFTLISKKFNATINPFLTILNETFTARMADRSNLEVAKKTEGALRVLSTISFKLEKKNSPVAGQIDKIIDTFVVPELNDLSLPFLSARACETISIFSYSYKDEAVLGNVFQGVIKCFQDDEHLPVQLEAADALRNLIQEEQVATILSPQVPQLMQKLLEMSRQFEKDLLTTVMEAFVERFAKQLEPFAVELSGTLSQQFIRLGTEILEMQSNSQDPNGYDSDKEYQAAGVLNTLTTMIISMNSSPDVTSSLEGGLAELIKFVLHNALVGFLSETTEILESLVFTTKTVTPIIWELYELCVESFQTYAIEFFDNFVAFFESVVIHGFKQLDPSSPHVTSLVDICVNIATTTYETDPTNVGLSFGLLEFIILSLDERASVILPNILSICYNLYNKMTAEGLYEDYGLDPLDFVKVILASLKVAPTVTLEYLAGNNLIVNFFQLWYENVDALESVFGLKLEILALMSIISTDNLPAELNGLFSQLSVKLVDSIEKLPAAMKKRQEILEKETSYNYYNVDDDEEEEEGAGEVDDFDNFEAEQAEIDAMRETPLDAVNVFGEFSNFFNHLKNNNPEKFNNFTGSLDENKINTIQTVLQITN